MNAVKSGWFSSVGPDGQPKKGMSGWDKLYWGFGLGGLALIIIPRTDWWKKKPKEDEEVRGDYNSSLNWLHG